MIMRYFLVLLMGVCASAWAEDYENFHDLAPGFGVHVGTGETGGNVRARNYKRSCEGYIDNTPDHVIRVKTAVDITLTVESEVDSVLLVTGPTGVLCDDDSAGELDAQLSGRFTPGEYQVFVGDMGDESGRYTLDIRERKRVATRDSARNATRRATPTPAAGRRGFFGDFTLGAGFSPSPQTATGLTGGPVSAATLDSQCEGWIDDTPDHNLTVTSAVRLRLTMTSDVDATLVVTGPAGTFCSEGAGDVNASLSAQLTPGEYGIYVGDFREQSDDDPGRYTLTVSEQR